MHLSKWNPPDYSDGLSGAFRLETYLEVLRVYEFTKFLYPLKT